MEEEHLAYGFVSSPVKVGNTVRRETGPWTPAIHALLAFLDASDFGYTQKVLGIDEKGREILEYLPGEAAVRPWPHQLLEDDGLVQAAAMLSNYHKIVKDFKPPKDAQWRIGAKELQPGEIIRHGDLGPWNTLWQGNKLSGLIDWDFAEPGRAITDLAQMAYYFVPLRGESGWQDAGFTKRPDLLHRLDVLCTAYGQFAPDEVLIELTHWLREEQHRTRERGEQGLEPWASFLERGDDMEIEEDIMWLGTLIPTTMPANSIEEALYSSLPTPKFIKKSALFGGRLDLTGYWLGTLYQAIFVLPLLGILFYIRANPDGWMDFLSEPWKATVLLAGIITLIFILGVSNLSLTVRRMHDIETPEADDTDFRHRMAYYLASFEKGNPGDNTWGSPTHSRHPLVILGLKHPSQKKQK